MVDDVAWLSSLLHLPWAKPGASFPPDGKKVVKARAVAPLCFRTQKEPHHPEDDEEAALPAPGYRTPAFIVLGGGRTTGRASKRPRPVLGDEERLDHLERRVLRLEQAQKMAQLVPLLLDSDTDTTATSIADIQSLCMRPCYMERNALLAPQVRVNASGSTPGNPAHNVRELDGRLWLARNSDATSWLMADLGGPTALLAYALEAPADVIWSEFVLEASPDARCWKIVDQSMPAHPHGSSRCTVVRKLAPHAVGRYVRLRGLRGPLRSEWVGLNYWGLYDASTRFPSSLREAPAGWRLLPAGSIQVECCGPGQVRVTPTTEPRVGARLYLTPE